jgi:hypothetical protein
MLSSVVRLLRRLVGTANLATQLAELSRACDRLAATQSETLAAMKDGATEGASASTAALASVRSELAAMDRRIQAGFDEWDRRLPELHEITAATWRIAARFEEWEHRLPELQETAAAARRIEARLDESNGCLVEMKETTAALHDVRREAGALRATLRTIALHRDQDSPRDPLNAPASPLLPGVAPARAADQPALRRKLMLADLAERQGAAGMDPARLADQQEELDACRAVEARCAFVMGFARSSTTITTQVINSDPRAFILGEANFHLPRPGCFRAAFNAQHRAYGGQISKSRYAPDFLGGPGATWWEYLLAASGQYDLVGDKVAFSSYVFGACDRASTMSFFEARFFRSRYIFLFRDPVQAVLSAKRLFSLRYAVSVQAEILAWLDMVMLWADLIRTFPHTLTVIADDLGQKETERILHFLGLRRPGATHLIDEAKRYRHPEDDLPPALRQYQAELRTVLHAVREALAQGMPVAPAEPDPAPSFVHAPQALEDAWAMASALRDRVATGNAICESGGPPAATRAA